MTGSSSTHDRECPASPASHEVATSASPLKLDSREPDRHDQETPSSSRTDARCLLSVGTEPARLATITSSSPRRTGRSRVPSRWMRDERWMDIEVVLASKSCHHFSDRPACLAIEVSADDLRMSPTLAGRNLPSPTARGNQSLGDESPKLPTPRSHRPDTTKSLPRRCSSVTAVGVATTASPLTHLAVSLGAARTNGEPRTVGVTPGAMELRRTASPEGVEVLQTASSSRCLAFEIGKDRIRAGECVGFPRDTTSFSDRPTRRMMDDHAGRHTCVRIPHRRERWAFALGIRTVRPAPSGRHRSVGRFDTTTAFNEKPPGRVER